MTRKSFSIEPIVDAGANDVCFEISSVAVLNWKKWSNETRRRRYSADSAQVDVKIFGFNRPIVQEGVFNPAASRPSRLGVGSGKRIGRYETRLAREETRE